MKILAALLDTKILDPETEKPFPVVEGQKELTPRIIAARALNNVHAQEARENPPNYEEGRIRNNIARRILKSGDVQLQAQEITKIKTLVGYMYGPVVIGAIEDCFEGPAELTDKPTIKD